jgi:hypothetical protein
MLPVTEIISQLKPRKPLESKEQFGQPLAPLIEIYLLQQERVNTVTAI